MYEWVAVTGKSSTKFGKDIGGRWLHGGNEFDYEIKWANGESTYEPETLAKEYAADAIEEFNLKHQPSTTENFQPGVDLPTTEVEGGGGETLLTAPKKRPRLLIFVILYTLVSSAICQSLSQRASIWFLAKHENAQKP